MLPDVSAAQAIWHCCHEKKTCIPDISNLTVGTLTYLVWLTLRAPAYASGFLGRASNLALPVVRKKTCIPDIPNLTVGTLTNVVWLTLGVPANVFGFLSCASNLALLSLKKNLHT
jgi:hypothetical protein